MAKSILQRLLLSHPSKRLVIVDWTIPNGYFGHATEAKSCDCRHAACSWSEIGSWQRHPSRLKHVSVNYLQ